MRKRGHTEIHGWDQPTTQTNDYYDPNVFHGTRKHRWKQDIWADELDAIKEVAHQYSTIRNENDKLNFANILREMKAWADGLPAGCDGDHEIKQGFWVRG